MSKGLQLTINTAKLGLGEFVADAEAAVRPAAQAGAQVIYDAVLRNVAGIKRHTGNLARSIYQVYSKDQSTSSRAVYEISWNHRKAPHGWLVEWGHLQRYQVSYDPQTRRYFTHTDRPLPTPKLVAARPFLRPALSLLPQADAAMRARYAEELIKKGHLK